MYGFDNIITAGFHAEDWRDIFKPRVKVPTQNVDHKP